MTDTDRHSRMWIVVLVVGVAGLIAGAILTLKNETRVVGTLPIGHQIERRHTP